MDPVVGSFDITPKPQHHAVRHPKAAGALWSRPEGIVEGCFSDIIASEEFAEPRFKCTCAPIARIFLPQQTRISGSRNGPCRLSQHDQALSASIPIFAPKRQLLLMTTKMSPTRPAVLSKILQLGHASDKNV